MSVLYKAAINKELFTYVREKCYNCDDAVYSNKAAKPQSRCLDKSLNTERVESRQQISRGNTSLLNHSITGLFICEN